jgi:uncharacterized DUF497 family protein
MSLVFEWDPKKAAENLGKHGTSFNEAAEVFDDPLAASVEDKTKLAKGGSFWLDKRRSKRFCL